MSSQLADIIQRYYDAFNRRAFAAYDDLFTADCLIDAPGVKLQGIEGARSFDKIWLAAMPDGKITSLNKTTSGAMVMCENRLTGHHTGDLVTPELTLPASGRAFDEPYAAVFEISGERIKRQTLHFDRVQVMKVLGPPDVGAANIKAAASVYEAFGRRDLQHILDLLADDVSWGIDGPREVPPYGILEGKQNVPRFFAGWAEIGDFVRFEAADFHASGQHVFNVLRHEFRMKATGKTVRQSSAQHWTFRSGKIIRWRGYEDTAATLAAYRT